MHRWPALAAFLSVLASSEDARAWYFPEHVVIGRDAVAQLSPEVRAVLKTAVAQARADGIPLCEDPKLGLEDVPRTKPLETKMVRTDHGADCIPYAALPAIAADHADGTTELRTVLTSKKGLELTSAAAHEWALFREAAEKLPNTPLERMTFVHELDVDFYFIDPGYELRAQASRSHFADAGRSLASQVRAAANARAVDNAIAQFLVHHYRSLQLAARGHATEALLEHGFAVHFLEDGFAAGHLVMSDRDWAIGNAHTRRRHDFFDAKGLKIGRALAAEPCAALEDSFEGGIPPCWTTTGDGYLGTQRDGSDRVHVARAVKKTELALAMALAPEKVVAFVEALGERERLAVAQLLDPEPWWTLAPEARRERTADPMALVRGAADAVARLKEGPEVPATDVGTRPAGDVLPVEVAETALEPCREGGAKSEDASCGPGRSLALGTVGTSLLRPMLVEWPVAQADVKKLEGEASIDHGIALQLFASIGSAAVFARDAPIDFFTPGFSGSLGIGYRFGTYLPGRRNRSGAELNLGISTALHFDGRGRDGGTPYVTMLDQEVRWPILWEALTSYRLPLDLQKSHDAGSIILLGGIRVHEMLTDPAPRFWGLEVEAAAFALWNGKGSYPLYLASPEIRLYVGAADASVAQPGSPHTWAPTLGLSFTSGYATFL